MLTADRHGKEGVVFSDLRTIKFNYISLSTHLSRVRLPGCCLKFGMAQA